MLHALPKTNAKPKKRLGRGYGTGMGGHTVGRGTKGQKSRSKVRLLFEGTKANKDFFRKTPMLRGKGKLKSHTKNPVTIKFSTLKVFKKGETVDGKSLIKHKLITEKAWRSRGAKILFDKQINTQLNLQVPASNSVLKALGMKTSAPTPKTTSRPAPKKTPQTPAKPKKSSQPKKSPIKKPAKSS